MLISRIRPPKAQALREARQWAQKARFAWTKRNTGRADRSWARYCFRMYRQWLSHV